MFCPETVLLSTRHLYIERYDGADYHRDVPWRIAYNPLRIGVTIRFSRWKNITVNRDGLANRWLSNLTWRLWRRARWEKKNSR